MGHFIADGDWLEREERRAEAAVMKAARDKDRAAERILVEYRAAVDALAMAALEAAGRHNHKGQWRRRRGIQST